MGGHGSLIDTSVLLGTVLPSATAPWAISMVTVGELEAGVLLARAPSARAIRLERLTAALEEALVLRVDRDVAAAYARLRAAAGRRPGNDLWIAATALAHGLRLITADRRMAALPLVEVEVLA